MKLTKTKQRGNWWRTEIASALTIAGQKSPAVVRWILITLCCVLNFYLFMYLLYLWIRASRYSLLKLPTRCNCVVQFIVPWLLYMFRAILSLILIILIEQNPNLKQKSWIFQYISNKMQRYTVYFIWKLLYMFRVVRPPVIRSSKTVSTASGICHTVTAICRYRGRVGTGLGMLWVVYATGSNSSTIAADSSNGVTNTKCYRYSFCAPDDGWCYHPNM
jgi:hypothetical protein